MLDPLTGAAVVGLLAVPERTAFLYHVESFFALSVICFCSRLPVTTIDGTAALFLSVFLTSGSCGVDSSEGFLDIVTVFFD